MMSFLHVAYLAAAAAVAGPIILHLLRRRPNRVFAFPSLMFLDRFAVRLQKRNNLRSLLVLLFRCMILLFIALAFAWPYLPRYVEAPQQFTVLLWDNSFSMEARPYRQELELYAQDYIDWADDVHPVSIGIVGDTVEWNGSFSGDKDELWSFFSRRNKPYGANRFEQALRQADLRLQTVPARSRRIVLITDRQLAPWQDVCMSRTLSPGTDLVVITPKKAGFKNVAITDCRVSDRLSQEGQMLKVQIRVKNFSKESFKAELETRLDNKRVNIRNLVCEPLSDQRVTVTLPEVSLAAHSGEVRLIVDDDVQADDSAFFAINPSEPPHAGFTEAPSQATQFIQLVLTPDPKRPRVKVSSIPSHADADKYSAPNVLVVCDGPDPGSDAVDRIDQTLAGGGRVIAVWRDSTAMRGWLGRYGIREGKRSGRVSGSLRLGSIDFEHPVFAPFLPLRSGNLFNILFYNPPMLELPERARVMARFGDGSPAIAELDVKQGSLVLIASELTREGTDWPVHATFLPFWRQMISNYSKDKLNDRLTASTRPADLGQIRKVVDIKRQTDVPLQHGKFIPGQTGNFSVEELGGRKRVISVNVPASESDPLSLGEGFDSSELISTEILVMDDAAGVLSRPEEEGQSFWWVLLAAVFALLLGEVLLANRTSL